MGLHVTNCGLRNRAPSPVCVRVELKPLKSFSRTFFTSAESPSDLYAVLGRGLEAAFPTFGGRSLGRIFGFPLENGLGESEDTSDDDDIWQPVEHPRSRGRDFETGSAALGRFSASLRSLRRLGSISPSSLVFRPTSIPVQFTREESALGEYVTLSLDKDNVASVHSSDDNDKMSEVFGKVLNGSTLVDFFMVSRTGLDSYFFIKNPIWRSSDDIMQLKRLGKSVNLTMHESQTDNTKILDVKVHLINVAVNVRYGAEAAAEKTRLLRHSLKLVSKRAWAREKEALTAGTMKPSKSDWTSREIRQITDGQGYADGYEVVYNRDPRIYPELANDLENVRFIATKGKKKKPRS